MNLILILIQLELNIKFQKINNQKKQVDLPVFKNKNNKALLC